MIRLSAKSAGFTLVEVIVAVMITAIAVTAIFSVIASNMVSERKIDTSEEVAMILSTAQEKLKPYVLANTNVGAESNPSPDYTVLPASMQKPKGLCPSLDNQPPLASGTHNITCLLPTAVTVLSGKGSGATIYQDGTSKLSYDVSYVANCGESATACFKVKFTLYYDTKQ